MKNIKRILILIIVFICSSMVVTKGYWASAINVITKSSINMVAETGDWAERKTIRYEDDTARKFYKVVAGDLYSMAIDHNGKLFSWGYNVYNRLGYEGTARTPIVIPTLVHKTIVDVSINTTHVLAITSNNEVYAWGNNTYGELGLGNNAINNLPKEITFFKENNIIVKSVVAGRNVSYAVTEDGDLYAWGFNLYYKTGNEDSNAGAYYTLPVKINYFVRNNLKVKEIKQQYEGAIARTEDDELYAWGYNGNGELGIGTAVTTMTPTRVAIPSNIKVKDYALGNYHGLVLGTDNKLYVWGYNATGQLGLGNTVRSLIPIVNPNTENLSISKIFAGYLSASALITSDNKIYVWGYSGYGRLGFPASMNTPKELPTSSNNEYNDIVFGDYHTLVGTKEGYIYGIGSNAQNQLGISTTGNYIPMSLINNPIFTFVANQIVYEGYSFDLYTYEKKGYEFKGWYLDRDYNQEYHQGFGIPNVLYARWQKIY